MFDHRQHILPMLPLSISEKEKLGKPKEEIGNLKMDLNICILMISKYNICKLNICILVILRYNISNLNILRIHISYFRGHNSTLWGSWGTNAWYVGRSLDHYWCNHYFVLETRAYRISGLAKLFPQHCQVPFLMWNKHLQEVIDKLITTIHFFGVERVK